MSGVFWGGVIGGVAGLTMTIMKQMSVKDKMFVSSISLEEFKSLEKDSYEVYYVGVEKDFNNINIEGVKLLPYLDMVQMKKLKSVDELPFDTSKELILIFANPTVFLQTEKLLHKLTLKYRTLGDYKTVLKNF